MFSVITQSCVSGLPSGVPQRDVVSSSVRSDCRGVPILCVVGPVPVIDAIPVKSVIVSFRGGVGDALVVIVAAAVTVGKILLDDAE